jgi:hypothetical protein
VTLENNDGVGMLHEWAYENTGAAIQVAAIPEPRAALLAGIERHPNLHLQTTPPESS